jgi:diaminohydroxyphosphoribosylaminopyrimidine deaminase/5-amino-6-(5-phosphoribosylamino)uracil reductase
MSEFSSDDRKFMQHALQLAERGRFGAHPNPMVGCVLVRDNAIVGEGWHPLAGDAHAEIVALRDAGDQAAGATAYVTLEPCSHHGKTPPCCDALIAAGVAAVMVARTDPNPNVNGQGIAQLIQAGIAVRTGLLQEEADTLMAGFLSRILRGRPRVRLKVAASLDGRTGMASGESQWITGTAARADVQRLRAAAGAVLTGVGTVLADDPSLNVRSTEYNPHDRQPLRVVLDSSLRSPPTMHMLSLAGDTLVFCRESANAGGLRAAGATVVQVAAHGEHVDLQAVLQELAKREINDVLVEAGPTLAGQLIMQQLIDELVIYQAPQILGSETRGMVTTPAWQRLADRLTLAIIDVTRIGDDLRITALPDYN